MAINPELKMDALALADEVLDAIKASPMNGITMHQGAAATGLSYLQFYSLANYLSELGKISIIRDLKAGNLMRLVLPNAVYIHEPVPYTPVQKKVLEYLRSKADERGLVHASLKEISTAIGHNSTCGASIDALDRRGFLEILHRGDSKRPRLYQIFPNGDGPKGWSASWFGPSRTVPMYAILTKENDHGKAD